MLKKIIYVCVCLTVLIKPLLSGDERRIQITDPNSSFFLVSVLKSVSGVKPSEEFFDMNVKLSFGENFFAFASADIAITGVSTDSLSSKQDKLTEAGFMLNLTYGGSNERKLFVGGNLKIFNTIPYVGVGLGSMEHAGPLVSSYLTLNYLYQMNGIDSIFVADLGKRMYRNNFYVEFALYSTKFDFLKLLRIKGGFLIPIHTDEPFKPSNNDIISRITIEVPLGEINPF